MSRGGPSAAELLDQAADLVVRRIPEWAALLALAALPLRLLEVHFVNRLLQLGAQAANHLDHLRSISWLITLALAPALAGRALFARACALARQSGGPVPARLVLRLPIAGFAGYAYAALAWQGLFHLTAWLLLPLPVLALGSGLALATAPLTGEAPPRPGPLASLALAVRRAPRPATCLALAATFALALGVALINLFFLFRLGLWLAGGIDGLDLAPWSPALGFGNRHFLLLLAAGAAVVVEPFWLASLVLAVRASRARESGEDIAARFAELRAAEVI